MIQTTIEFEGRRYHGVVLDLDGVITDTASLHFNAWKRVFEPLVADRQAHSPPPFTWDEYRRFVDGISRLDGTRGYLESRGITLPLGSMDDPPGTGTFYAVGNMKNQLFREILDEEGVKVYPDAYEALVRWRQEGLPTALISASQNAGMILKRAGLTGYFQAVVEGLATRRKGLKGKPAPDIFTEAARLLHLEPSRLVAVEDARAGVEAAAAAGFGLVVGLAREGAEAELKAHGAQVVLQSLDQLDSRARVGPPPVMSAADLPDALKEVDQLARWVRRRKVLLFLDFDGTLSPIVPDPAAARLAGGLGPILDKVTARWPAAMVSGRDRRDVEARVGIGGIFYAGSHGFDIAGPGVQRIHEDGLKAMTQLDRAEGALEEALRGIPGALVDRKRFAIAVHYRNVSHEHHQEVEDAVDQAVSKVTGLSKHSGRKVFELKPAVDWDKGRAVEWLLEIMVEDDPEVAPIYIGDDITDEDAFRALRQIGLGILVGAPPRPTMAHYRLESPEAVGELLTRLLERCDIDSPKGWRLQYDSWEPDEQPLREALCTLGNGRFASRGAFEEVEAGGVHYPGTYLAGGYNRMETHIAGRRVENEDLVNWPNWLLLSFRHEGGAWLDMSKVEVLSFRQVLDIRAGILHRHVRFRDPLGRISLLQTRRLVHMSRPRLAALDWTLTPENWSGKVEVRSGLNGAVRNEGVKRYRDLEGNHLEPEEWGPWAEGVSMVVETRQSRIRMAQASRTRFLTGNEYQRPSRTLVQEPGFVAEDMVLDCQEGLPMRLEKVVAVTTSRDPATSEARLAALEEVAHAPPFEVLAREHSDAWDRLWYRCDMRVDDPKTQAIVRLHLLHLLQTVSINTIDLDAGVPARGLHGEAYRGHVFWDELFIFPYLNLRIPEITRALLMYRIRRLPVARRLAAQGGFQGAMFPWQSGSDGREETQELHLNPRSGRWKEDNTRLQRHATMAVAFNTWQYYQATGDLEFMSFYGCALFLEVARFVASLTSWDPHLERFRIRGVMGPDEFHDAYPGASTPGLDDNTYTNVLAAWVLQTAPKVLALAGDDRRQELKEELNLGDAELARWREVASRLRVVFHRDGIMSQFDGYEDLEEFDWAGYRERYGDIHRLDRILESEGDTPNRYKVAKQGDVLMLLYLFSVEELQSILSGMGYSLQSSKVPAMVDYYGRRSSHGSTLSRVVHSWVVSRTDRSHSWSLFQDALRSDVEDIQSGTTAEGIHLGAMAGTVDLLQRCYLGLEMRDDMLWLNPCLPEELPRLTLPLRYRGHQLTIQVTGDSLLVTFQRGRPGGVRISIGGQIHEFKEGDSREFTL